jgi:hypothetical protein
MNNSTKTTRQLAQIWWGKLPEKDREILLTYHTNLGTLKDINSMTQSVETIYLSEHPQTEQPKPEVLEGNKGDLLEGITLGEWEVLKHNYTHFATINAGVSKRICTIDVGETGLAPINEAEANAHLISLAPHLAKSNVRLKEVNKMLVETLEKIKKTTDNSTVRIIIKSAIEEANKL